MAVNQKENGGLPKNGMFSKYMGVIQSPLKTIRIAIAAYLDSVVSNSGYTPSVKKRRMSIVPRINNRCLDFGIQIIIAVSHCNLAEIMKSKKIIQPYT